MLPQFSSNQAFLHIKQGKPVNGTPRFFKGYRTNGKGVYVEWRWHERSLVLETDQSGFIPVYYYADNDQVIVGTEIRIIFDCLTRAPSIDPVAFSLLMRLGFLIGDKTPFHGVRRLGPSGVLKWSSGKGLSVSQKYAASPSIKPTRQEALKIYADLFKTSMENLSKLDLSCTAIPLSGGRDSRHIALELHAMGVEPLCAITCRHIPPKNDEDVRVAKSLCESLSWRHIVVSQGDRLRQEIAHSHAADFLSYEHAWTLPLRNRLQTLAPRFVFDGVAGDILSAGLFQDESQLRHYLNEDLRQVSSSLLTYWKNLGGELALRQTLGKHTDLLQSIEETESELTLELEKHLGQPNPLKSFYFWNRSRCGTGLLPFKILGSFNVLAPFLDADLFTFLLSLPPEITADKQFHSEAISTTYPHFAHVGYEDPRSKPRSISTKSTLPLRIALLATGSSRFVDRKFIVPRAVGSFLTFNSNNHFWWNERRVLYLLALENFCNEFGLVTKQPDERLSENQALGS